MGVDYAKSWRGMSKKRACRRIPRAWPQGAARWGGGLLQVKVFRKCSIWCIRSCRIVTIPMPPLESLGQ